jgi:hypothetical protein
MTNHFDAHGMFIEEEAKKLIKALFRSLPNVNYITANSIFMEALEILKTHSLNESVSSFNDRISEFK